MKVMITRNTSIISIADMWYGDYIGKVFEVEADPKFDQYYRTVEPIYKDHTGHILKTDCVEVWDVLPQAIKATEPLSAATAVEDFEMMGNKKTEELR